MPNPVLPPGPRLAPIQSLRYMLDAYGYTERMCRRYGDPFTMPSLNGRLVLTSSSEGARQILGGREEDFVIGFGVDALAPLLGTGSLLLQSGEPHRREPAANSAPGGRERRSPRKSRCSRSGST